MRQPLRATLSVSLQELQQALGLAADPGPPLALTGVATDSRDVEPGDLFVALVGERHDGHGFLEAALSAGAAAVLVQQTCEAPAAPVLRVEDTLDALGRLGRYWRRRCGPRLVAVTGSNGKTTTKEMVAAVLAVHAGSREDVLVTPGNFNNYIGLPLTLLGASPRQAVGVVELGMNAPGEIAHLTALAEPEVGVVTNAAEAHLMRFGSVDGVARAKAELWGGLSRDACAVVPADDARLVKLARERAAGPRSTFGWSEEAEIRVLRAEPTAGRALSLSLRTPRGNLDVTLPLLGRHNGLNAAAATAACLALGVELAAVREGLGATLPLPHRARLLQLGGVTVLDDCYNANPPSVRAGAATLLELPGNGRAGAVIGDMLELGDDALPLHEALGRELARLGVEVVVGLGPLTAALCAGAREGGAPEVVHVASAQEAAQEVRRRFGAGDRVLVKGSRGMELESVIAHWQLAVAQGEGS
ncbi:MAG: UDP-N-acetylmuramoyl-tripeptide--D-alanyl-D-alanine ligase [bacterium]